MFADASQTREKELHPKSDFEAAERLKPKVSGMRSEILGDWMSFGQLYNVQCALPHQ